ncbi:ATP-binding protein [Microbacterium ulmi]|uniref:ATP-binding protein n=2 Tax=Microbacterium ulmi TaxID=179095 RepID=A0A7Y2PZK2_9MICO|nr:ATP-binding protein [Microbacterium ulmi]NNH03383.1 ATP-binding protein [Microbacterium ulmi]
MGSFTRIRVERIISVAAGLGSLVLGAQALVTALGPSEELPAWHLPLLVATFAPLAAMILACLVGRGVRFTAGTFAIVYIAALAVWPLATQGSTPAPTDEPWIWYLVNIATLAAVLAFPLPLQLVWTIVAPLLFGLVRLIQGGFGPEDLWIAVALDVSFALILGGVLLSLGWVFRSVAANVDRTRARAVDSYAAAAAADAAEAERVAVAALMHDSVLAALIAAERAETPRERSLAVGMAREALTRLANTEQDASEGSDEPTDAATVADEIERSSRELGIRLVAERTIDPEGAAIPGRVGRALALAAAQAIANAVQHADGRGLAVAVRGVSHPAAVRIDVRDTGGGFALEEVPDDRLGIRGSIIARVAAVGGTARIDAGEVGTTVRLEWREEEP